jgi:ElaB/YqjD/DUF883 family membrane-anchored ribosome-binding protein
MLARAPVQVALYNAWARTRNPLYGFTKTRLGGRLISQSDGRKGEVMPENEKRSLVGKAVRAGGRVVEVGAEAARLKVQASHAVEDAKASARRLAKRGRYAADDLVDETAYRIKRDPFRSVAIVLAVGLGVGALAGWLAGRMGRN